MSMILKHLHLLNKFPLCHFSMSYCDDFQQSKNSESRRKVRTWQTPQNEGHLLAEWCLFYFSFYWPHFKKKLNNASVQSISVYNNAYCQIVGLDIMLFTDWINTMVTESLRNCLLVEWLFLYSAQFDVY